MRIVLINPPQNEEDLRSAFSKGKGFILPYNLLSLGTYLKQGGAQVDILDCVAEGINADKLSEIVRTRSYDMAGITAFTFTVPQLYKAAQVIKNSSPATKIVLGGIHASVLPEQTLERCQWADFVVIGAGEKTLRGLMEAIENSKGFENIPNLVYREKGQVKTTELKPILMDPKELPIPDYSLIKMQLYVPHSGNYRVLPTYSFYASRGCPYSCAFCSANIVLGKQVRYKEIGRAIKEIKILAQDYGAQGLIFQDSTFTLDRKWVKEFCSRMVREKLTLVWRANTRVDCVDVNLLRVMKQAGCYRINMGFESGNQDTLDFLKKGTTIGQNISAARMVLDEGLELGASFIIGLPNENMEKVLNTICFAKKIGARFTQFYLPVPYPGTKLRELCQEGMRENAQWKDYSSRDFSKAVYINKNFSEDEFKKLTDFAYQKYYCNFKAIKRILFPIKSMAEFKDSLKILNEIRKKWLNQSFKKITCCQEVRVCKDDVVG
ncbi:MAG: B12-binding domain-containing radical SAM protein [Omnitrophica bacterium]|nr:B12-binding domain-containing radical SAM protein [Candidatus Omnitrophota bacterium]